MTSSHKGPRLSRHRLSSKAKIPTPRLHANKPAECCGLGILGGLSSQSQGRQSDKAADQGDVGLLDNIQEQVIQWCSAEMKVGG